MAEYTYSKGIHYCIEVTGKSWNLASLTILFLVFTNLTITDSWPDNHFLLHMIWSRNPWRQNFQVCCKVGSNKFGDFYCVDNEYSREFVIAYVHLSRFGFYDIPYYLWTFDTIHCSSNRKHNWRAAASHKWHPKSCWPNSRSCAAVSPGANTRRKRDKLRNWEYH